MKRLRQFELSASSPQGQSSGSDLHQFQSWHKSCHWVSDYFENHSQDHSLKIVATDPKTGLVICEFSYRNLESEEKDEADSEDIQPAWESRVFQEVAERSVYENRNIRELCWDLLDGAQRDVPFLLSLIERKSQARGLVGTCFATLQDIRNVFFS